MEKIGYDIDGTLTFWEGGSRLNRKAPAWLFYLLIFSVPRFKIIRQLRRQKRAGKKIILISNRPKELVAITKMWLFLWRIPFDELVLIGYFAGARGKAKVVKKKEVKIFHDNKVKVSNELSILDIACQLV
jgi:uncharacterized HAD superfamily protein